MNAWDVPIYSPAFASRLIGLTADRVRRWLRGYEYRYSVKQNRETRTGRKKPVVGDQHLPSDQYASFLDLIDLLFVKKFLSNGFSLQKLRKALDEVRIILGDHHFARKRFFSDGKNIYLDVKNDAEALLQLLSGGQWAIAPLIIQTSEQIDFDRDTGFAKKWYPRGPNGLVVVDPNISFGTPTIVGRGIPTANIYDLFMAENENVERVCSWMDVEKEEVESAVEFETLLLAA